MADSWYNVDVVNDIQFALKHYEGEQLVEELAKLVQTECDEQVRAYREVALATIVEDIQAATAEALLRTYNAVPERAEDEELPEW